jgi:hypothetical protein
MTDTLRNNPPEWLWPEEAEDLPNPAGSTGGPEYMPRHPSDTQ